MPDEGRGHGVRTGCDLQPVADVADAVRDFGPRYLDRVYTPREQEDCRRGGAASLAARFAAKEAVLKLIGEPDGVDLRSIETDTRQGRPVVRLRGRAADLAARAGLGAAGVDVLAAVGAATLILVSCDIGAFGRDVGLLARAGYALDHCEVVDLFPHTPHAEVVSRFRR